MSKIEFSKINLSKSYMEQYRKQFGICHLCGEKMIFAYSANPYAVSRDHVIPASKGGKWRDAEGNSNIKLAHAWCNSDRKDLPVKHYNAMWHDATEAERRRKGIDSAHCNYLFLLYDKERIARHTQRVDNIFSHYGVGVADDADIADASTECACLAG